MATFIFRRIIAAFLITLGATFIAYILVAYAGDPLAAARGLPNPQQRAATVATITQTLHLDVNPIARYFIWLKGVLGCFVGQCDFGLTITQQPVTPMLSSAVVSSLKLITASTILAVFLGIAIGVVSALRQYSGLDYSVTFLAFLFFSLPVFWIGVLLKDTAGHPVQHVPPSRRRLQLGGDHHHLAGDRSDRLLGCARGPQYEDSASERPRSWSSSRRSTTSP